MAVIVPIDADVSGLTRKLGAATHSLGGFGKMALVAAGAAGLGALVTTMKIGVEEFMASSRVTAQTNAVLKSTGQAAGVTARQVSNLATQLEQKSMIDDEAIQSGENLLLTFTKVRNEAGKGNDIFTQATKTMVDVATAMNMDASTAAIQLGKALNDPIRGVGQLRKVGVSFTEAQRDQIKALVESGKTIEAQKMILRELQTEFGGSAEAAGKTLPGQLTILRNTFNNIAGDLVATFMPAIVNAATTVGRFITTIAGMPTAKARIDFVFETAEQVASRFWNWWTQPSMKTVRSPTSGVIVTFEKPGSERVNKFIIDLDTAVKGRVENWASDLGYNIPGWIFGGAKKNKGDAGKGLLITLLKWVNPVYQIAEIGKTGGDIARAFWESLKQWFDDNPGLAVKKIKEWLASAGDALGGAAGAVWRKVSEQFSGEARRMNLVPMTNAMRQRITSAVAEAVQGARQNLQGLGGSVGDMVAQIMGTASTGGNALRAAMKERQDAREETRLRDAVATAKTVEDQKKAEEDLQDFLDTKEADRLDKEAADNQAAAKQRFADLVAEFNTGAIDLGTFQSRFQGLLNEYIGADYGSTLGGLMGTSFATTFQQTVAAALSQAGLIPAGAAGISGPGTISPGQVESETTRAERQQQYENALQRWQTRRDQLEDRLKRLRDKANDEDSPGGKERTAAEQKRIDEAREALEAWVSGKPKRGEYGLLAAGGILTGPKFLAGEAGNEAVIPLSSPTASEMMRRAFADSVTGGNTVINVEINAGLGTDPAELGREVVKAIKQFERKNGPVFAGA